jgi:hypothetical protein
MVSLRLIVSDNSALDGGVILSSLLLSDLPDGRGDVFELASDSRRLLVARSGLLLVMEAGGVGMPKFVCRPAVGLGTSMAGRRCEDLNVEFMIRVVK